MCFLFIFVSTIGQNCMEVTFLDKVVNVRSLYEIFLLTCTLVLLINYPSMFFVFIFSASHEDKTEEMFIVSYKL
jgi:hypothetical protein